MRKICLFVLIISIVAGGCFASAYADKGTVYYSSSDEIVDLSFHAGVKLGMTKEEVCEAELGAGNQLVIGYGKNKVIVKSPDDVKDVNTFRYDGSVAGVADSCIYYAFRPDNGTLYTITYSLTLPKGTASQKKDRQAAFDSIEQSYIKKYGEADYSSAMQTYWKYAELIQMDYGNNSSAFATRVDDQILDYAQRIYIGSDKSVILIEHVIYSTSGDMDFIRYMLYDADSVQKVYQEYQDEQKAISDDI